MTVLALVSLLTLHGCSLAGAAGVVANLQAESGLNPEAVRGGQLGLPQWQGARRRRLLATFGRRWRDPVAQVSLIVAELRELRLWAPVCGAGADAEAAARIFMLEFERPRARNPSYRMGLARAVYGQMAAHRNEGR
jgi:hypothetical protein